MHAQLSDVHPLIGEAMIFMNKDEDPELARLAAERYTQYKMNQLQSPSETTVTDEHGHTSGD